MSKAEFENKDFNPDDFWPEAESMLDAHFKKVKVRKIWYWIVSLVLLISISSAVVWNYTNSSDNKRAQESFNNSGNLQLTAGSLKEHMHDNVSGTLHNNNSVSSAEENKVTKGEENNKQNGDYSTKKESQIHLNNSSDDSISKYDKIKRNRTAKEKLKRNVATILNNGNEIQEKRPKHKRKGVNVKEALIEKTDFASGKMPDKTDVNPKNEQALSESSTVTLLQKSLLNLLKRMDMLSVTTVGLNSTNLIAKEQDVAFRKNSFWGITLYGTPQFVFKQVASDNYGEYINKRRSEEKSIITSGAGAQVSFNFSNFSVNGGIEYTAIGEKLDYKPYTYQYKYTESEHWDTFNVNTTKTDTVYRQGITHYHYSTIQTRDSSIVVEKDSTWEMLYSSELANSSGINKFSYFEIPFECGYMIPVHKFQIGVKAGISPAWLVSKKGNYINRDITGREQLNQLNEINKFILNGRFNFEVHYLFNDRFSLLLRPQFRANLMSVFKSNYQIKQYYYSTGINIGLTYRFK